MDNFFYSFATLFSISHVAPWTNFTLTDWRLYWLWWWTLVVAFAANGNRGSLIFSKDFESSCNLYCHPHCSKFCRQNFHSYNAFYGTYASSCDQVSTIFQKNLGTRTCISQICTTCKALDHEIQSLTLIFQKAGTWELAILISSATSTVPVLFKCKQCGYAFQISW